MKLLKFLLDQGVSPDCLAYEQATALQYAIMRGEHCEAMAILLLQYGATVDLTVAADVPPPLMLALSKKNRKLVRNLLARGADPNSGHVDNRYNNCPFIAAELSEGAELVDLLLLAGARVRVVKEARLPPGRGAPPRGRVEFSRREAGVPRRFASTLHQ